MNNINDTYNVTSVPSDFNYPLPTNNNNSGNHNKGKYSLMITLIITVIFIYIVYPIGKKYLDTKNKTFNITVEVEKIYPTGRYQSGNLVTDITDPWMKCKITNINRNNYQKENMIPGEPKMGDILYISEIHGDYYPQLTQFNVLIRDNEIVDGQYELHYGKYDYLDRNNEETINDSDNTISVSNEESEEYIQDYRGWIPEDQKNNIQSYLEQKYLETGIRMYLIFYDTNDKTYMEDHSKALLNSKNGQAISYSRNANDNSWQIWWIASSTEKNEFLQAHYTSIGDAYLINGSYEERIKNVIDTAYELFQE